MVRVVTEGSEEWTPPCSREAEVTDFEVAAGIQKEIARLQVAVQNICRVDVLQASEHLQDIRLLQAQFSESSRLTDEISLEKLCRR